MIGGMDPLLCISKLGFIETGCSSVEPYANGMGIRVPEPCDAGEESRIFSAVRSRMAGRGRNHCSGRVGVSVSVGYPGSRARIESNPFISALRRSLIPPRLGAFGLGLRGCMGCLESLEEFKVFQTVKSTGNASQGKTVGVA